MRFLILSLFLLTVTISLAQKDAVLSKVAKKIEDENLKWYEGSVNLWVDNLNVSGYIQFNELTQVLRFKMDEGGAEILKPYQVKSFEFFIRKPDSIRTFLAIDTTKNLYFYEIILKTKYFSLLRKKSPIKGFVSEMRNESNNLQSLASNRIMSTKVELGQEIGLYFHSESNRSLYTAIVISEIETKGKRKKANNYFLKPYQYINNNNIQLDEKLLIQLMDVFYPRVKEFIKNQQLNKNDIDDLIKIVAYFKELEEKE